MTESRNIHWAEDEALLERFVLGRVEPIEAAALGTHLEECDKCRILVARELDLLTGIRLAGRDALKRRLGHAIERRSAESVSWYRLVGVAAGIVLLITVGLSYRWFMGSETQVEYKESAENRERLGPAPSATLQGQISKEKGPRADAGRQGGGHEKRKVQGQAAGAPKSVGVESGRLSESRDDKRRDLSETDAVSDKEMRGKKDGILASSASTPDSKMWVEGTLISRREYNRPAATEPGARAADERGLMLKGKEENLLAGKAARTEAKQEEAQNFVVTQKLVSELPANQQSQRRRANSVQTLFQKKPDGTELTVFLDSLVTNRELDRVRVQPITEDSIILYLGNRRVGYRLPAEWTGQGLQQSKKVK